MDQGLRLAIEATGTRYALAKGLGISPSVVLRWTRIPYERLLQVEELTGIGRNLLCPELFSGREGKERKPRIFISHNAEDLEIVELIRKYAKEHYKEIAPAKKEAIIKDFIIWVTPHHRMVVEVKDKVSEVSLPHTPVTINQCVSEKTQTGARRNKGR